MKPCIKYCLPIGKAVRLELVLDSKDINTKLKLEKLCHGSFIWVHCSADDNGIYGWIDNNGTKVLFENQSTFVQPKFPRLEENSEEIIESIKDIIRIALNNGLGLLYGNSLDFDNLGDPKYYKTIKLINNEEYLGGRPRFNFETVKDYSRTSDMRSDLLSLRPLDMLGRYIPSSEIVIRSTQKIVCNSSSPYKFSN